MVQPSLTDFAHSVNVINMLCWKQISFLKWAIIGLFFFYFQSSENIITIQQK